MGAGREEIAEIMQRTGLTETEARAGYHLREAYETLREVGETPAAEGIEPQSPLFVLVHITPHIEALNNFLARRVLERERPEGWQRGSAADDEES